MKLGLVVGYWGNAGPPPGVEEQIAEAEQLGFDSMWTAEAYGSDAFTPLAWWGRTTSTLKLGTSVVQLSARTPAATAMSAITMDHLSGGRLILGLGASGPQVVEGWYGAPFGKPLARTREVVDIIRQVLAREAPVTNEGRHYPLPFTGVGSVGLGKPLKPIVHPLRADIPIWLGAEGPKNVAQSAEIADGWIPIFYSPASAAMYQPWLDEGFARPGARRTRDDFEIAATCHLEITDDPAAVIAALKPSVALYMGGMGAKEQNFHKQVFDRMGYADVADKVQELYLAGSKEQATALVPDELVDQLHIIGDAAKVRDRVQEWEDSGVSTLLLSLRSADEVRAIAEVVGDA